MIFKGYLRCRLFRSRPSSLSVLVLVTFTLTMLVILHHHTNSASQVKNIQRHSQGKIIVSSYMRSGSTLTADIIQHAPGVFYVFEPLYAMEKVVKMYLAPIFLYKPFKMIQHDSYSVKMRTLMSFMDCKLEEVDLTTLHQHHMDRSLTTLEYSKCIQNTSLQKFETKCLDPLIQMCRNSQSVLLKTIRTKMEYYEELLHLNLDFKVILLLRDPRGILFSRARLYNTGPKGREALDHHIHTAPTLCSSMLRDLKDAHRLAKLYPGRVAILLYEKLVQNPQLMTKIMYEFLGLEFTDDIGRYVHNITNAGLPDNCPVCTTRSNATETARRWRMALGFNDVMFVDQSCVDLYEHVGFVSFSSDKELYNLNLPAWREKYVPNLLTDLQYAKTS